MALASENTKDIFPFVGTSKLVNTSSSLNLGTICSSRRQSARAPRRWHSLESLRRIARSCGLLRSRLYFAPGAAGSKGYSLGVEYPLPQPSITRLSMPLPSRVSIRITHRIPVAPNGLLDRSRCRRCVFESMASSMQSAARKSTRLSERSSLRRHRSRPRYSAKWAAAETTSPPTELNTAAEQFARLRDFSTWFSVSFSPMFWKTSAEKEFQDRSRTTMLLLEKRSPMQRFTSTPLPRPESAILTSRSAGCERMAAQSGMWHFSPICTPLRSKFVRAGAGFDKSWMTLLSVPMPAHTHLRRLSFLRAAEASFWQSELISSASWCSSSFVLPPRSTSSTSA
mmetsp:Transcript_23131/g.65793  ORF Transcript_23131/g.65793 Transcript_23131/m.65793 type:complete len:340 (-) Transcript_23131:102-1121(-)